MPLWKFIVDWLAGSKNFGLLTFDFGLWTLEIVDWLAFGLWKMDFWTLKKWTFGDWTFGLWTLDYFLTDWLLDFRKLTFGLWKMDFWTLEKRTLENWTFGYDFYSVKMD